MPYAKKRESIFGTILTPINTNISNISENKRKKNLFKNNTQDFIETKNFINATNEPKISEGISDKITSVCCNKNHIINFSNSEKNEIFNYYNSMKSNDQKNEYLKSVVVPQNLIQTNSTRSSNFEYFVQLSDKNNNNLIVRKKVCKNAFLILHNIKDSKLRKKIQRNRNETEDKRGKHNSHVNKIPLEVEIDIRDFLENYPSRETHYGTSVKTGRKYIESDKNINILFNEFIEEYEEYDNYVNYQFFRIIFKDCNIGIGFSRSDICSTCEEINVKISYAINEKTNLLENELKSELDRHQFEAKTFYELQSYYKNLAKSDSSVKVISMDYQKNFFLPITKVCPEYYSRQLSIHNFGIHDMGEEKALMFMFSENFAQKGANETISILNYYISNKINNNIKKIYIFSDNAFGQMKSRYLWLFYDILVKCEIFEEINIIYPIVGHSYNDCDRDFGLIEKLKLKVHKIALPQEWVKLVKTANKKNPFEVIYVNHPLTDDLKPDSSDICTVFDYKTFFDPFLKPKLNHLKEVRRMKLTKNSVKISLDLSKDQDTDLNLYKSNENIDFFHMKSNVNLAYNDFLPIKIKKYKNIKMLLNYIKLPPSATFYSNNYLKCKESENILTEDSIISILCKCKGKCVKKCFCKSNYKTCSISCLCNKKFCKNSTVK